MKLGEKDMALMLSQHWGSASQATSTRDSSTAWIARLSRTSRRPRPAARRGGDSREEAAFIGTLRALFLRAGGRCCRHSRCRESSSSEVSPRMEARLAARRLR